LKVIVVGGGIAGLSTAWSLVKGGHDVTLLERGPIPNPLSASGDHHRIIRRAYGAAEGYARTISEAFDAWDEMWADLGQSHLAAIGVLCVSQTPGDEAERFRDGLDRGGYRYEQFEARESARRYPFLDPATFRYSFLSPEGGALYCRRIAAGLAAWLAARGADVRTSTEVTALDAIEGRVRLSTGETLAADRVVVAAGAWTNRLVPPMRTVLTVYRTALAYVTPPEDLAPAWQGAPVLLDIGGNADAYVVPPGGGGGMKFGTGHHRVATDDPDADRFGQPGEGEAIRRWFSPPLARLEEYRIADVVTCAYTFTRDERFIAEQIGRALIVSACSGHGYKFGAAVGRRVARAVADGQVEDLKTWLRAEQALAA
jgi:sarcosine oxidase